MTLYLALFLPLFGFLSLIMLGKRVTRKGVGIWASSLVFLSFLCFLFYLFNYMQGDGNPHILMTPHIPWISLKGLEASYTLHLDTLSLLMSLIITGIGFLIHVYSIGYLEDDESFLRYFAFLNFFIFAMLLLILAGDLLLLFVGWEGVGLASYLLIGFWYEKETAAIAATKAFIVNRVGDFGFLLGLFFTFYLFGTSDIPTILHQAGESSFGRETLTVLTLLFFLGAIGKSAQLPLHVWLPDAMEGPTPVSALIHAATMVTAGVYLLVRMHPLFLLTPFTLQVVGFIGATTSLFAAFSAIGQIDLKRVLAYSTISQLGLMFLAIGAEAFYSAMFHLTTHAFIKALLFLSAGIVVHRLHGVTDMKEMGGLSKIFKKTHLFFLLGVLSLSGIPPLAAFFSKELILEQEFLIGCKTFFYVGFATSVLTAFYLVRAYCLTFLGPLKDSEKNVTEGSKVMLWPLVLLAVGSFFGGLLNFTFQKEPLLEDFLEEISLSHAEVEIAQGTLFTTETLLATLGILLATGFAFILYTRYPNRLKEAPVFLKKAFYVDEIYHFLFAVPIKFFSESVMKFFEPKLNSFTFVGIPWTVNQTASFLQKMQNGQIRFYIGWIILGIALIGIFFRI